MPYYHVLLTLNASSENEPCVLRDLDKRALLSSFVSRYKAGKDILSGSEIISLASIRSVRIIATDRPMDESLAELDAKNEAHRQELNQGSSGLVFMGGMGSAPNDIAEVGQNVTSQFIKDVPGSAVHGGVAARFLGNPWLVAVGGAVVAAGITAWLKWN
jgi:hypothetical protein